MAQETDFGTWGDLNPTPPFDEDKSSQMNDDPAPESERNDQDLQIPGEFMDGDGEKEQQPLLENEESDDEDNNEKELGERFKKAMELTLFLNKANALEMESDLNSTTLNKQKVEDYYNAMGELRNIEQITTSNTLYYEVVRSEIKLCTQYHAWKLSQMIPKMDWSNPIPIRLGKKGILPSKPNKDSVTYDLFASRRTTIPPGEVRAVPLDIFFSEMAPPYFAQISPRAGLAHSKQISAIPATISPRMNKSIAVSVQNNSRDIYTFDVGSRVANLQLGPNPWCGITNDESIW